MAMGLNKVTLIGHLGADPEVKTTQNGNSVCNFRIATTDSWTDKQSGERVERTEWHSVVCWNENIIKILEQYTSKGSRVYLEGKLKTRKWQHNDGSDRYTTEVVMEVFGSQLLLLGDAAGSRDDNDDAKAPRSGAGGRSGGGQGGSSQSKKGGSRAKESFEDELDDQIPF